jgi:hypothetical protein
MDATTNWTPEEPDKNAHWALRPQLSTALVVAWVSTVAFGIVGMVGFGILLAR